jgi:hypothetical protein
MAAVRTSLAGEPTRSLSRPAVITVSVISLVALLALVVLIVRELLPHHARLAGGTARTEAPAVTPQPQPVLAPASMAAVKPVVALASPQAAAPSLHSDGLSGIRSIASIIRDPDSHPSEGVFHDRVHGVDHFTYEGFGPYRRGELKRDVNDPSKWEIEAFNGPGHMTHVETIAPPGGTREAATVKDDKGNVVGTWFVVETGPLAPAYATIFPGGGTRVVSRAYLEANKASFPQSVVSMLDQ